ncbi:MAG: hypothetical protein ACQEWU_13215 [Bacillota bacterium]|uniref:Uncharacterized protein n=1 Tax=Virgibacillus salarius TaxID=447199 RepID=A0A941IB92_9BACI|nr:hypothetical protein [Virgibacillus salarius]MBR7797493.1 hypothetical protein [Virgibacillus salarius]NAZ10204.1 hypothetical protein [Agaribacter marinus]
MACFKFCIVCALIRSNTQLSSYIVVTEDFFANIFPVLASAGYISTTIHELAMP